MPTRRKSPRFSNVYRPARPANLPSTEAVAACYAQVLQEEYTALLPQRWCIEATRLTRLVMRQFDIKTRAQEVAISLHRTSQTSPGITAPGVIWGFRPLKERLTTATKWDGHLVAVTDDGLIIDAAISQFRRADLGIWTPDVMIEHAARFGAVGSEVVFDLDTLRMPTRVTLMARALDPSVPESPVWRAPETELLADMITARMRRRLAPRSGR